MIACLSVPYFATAVERRDDQALDQRSLILGGQPWEPRPLFGYSREAAQCGVRPGMTLRLAHTLSPHAHFMPAALSKYQLAAGEIIDTLTDFTHFVEPDNLWQLPEKPPAFLPAAARSLPARYYIDLESLPLHEATPLAREIGRAVRQRTALQPALGLAADPFTAHVAATLSRTNHLRSVEPHQEEQFLASQSIAFLPLERETARRLRLLGIRTLGQFAALSPTAVQEQFGPQVLPLHRLARGYPQHSARSSSGPAEPRLSHAFDPPVADQLVLQNVLERLAGSLAAQLQAMHHAAGLLSLRLQTEQGALQQQCTLRQPIADEDLLARRLHGLLQQLPPPAPVLSLAVSASALAPLTARQLSLFKPPSAHQVGRLLPAIMARHKSARFYRPCLADIAHPLPEQRFRLQPLP